jgi:hypothetical protein
MDAIEDAHLNDPLPDIRRGIAASKFPPFVHLISAALGVKAARG